MRQLCITAAVFIVLIFTSCQAESLEVIELVIGGETYVIEIADTPGERQLGLMHRKSLAKNHGMLFVFEDEQPLSFWMKNTYIDLSIAYIDAHGRIVDILDMAALDESPVRSSRDAKYALELNRGTFNRLGVYEGDVLDLGDISAE